MTPYAPYSFRVRIRISVRVRVMVRVRVRVGIRVTVRERVCRVLQTYSNVSLLIFMNNSYNIGIFA